MSDNWYIVLELPFSPAVEDEKTIAARIEEKRKFWSTHTQDFKMGVQYRKWLDSIPKIKKDMLGTENIRTELASEAVRQHNKPIDRSLKMISAGRSNITDKEVKNIAARYNSTTLNVMNRARLFDITVVADRSSGTKQCEPMDAARGEIYEAYYKAKPKMFNGFKAHNAELAFFNSADFYTFLYGSVSDPHPRTYSCEKLKTDAEDKKNSFVRSDAESSNGSKLCQACIAAFENKDTKQTYDEYLDYITRKSILDDVKEFAEISGMVRREAAEAAIKKLSVLMDDKALAEKLLSAFCAAEKLPLDYHVAAFEKPVVSGINVGIDLGTTFSAVAMVDKTTGKPVVISNRYGRAVTPSVICFKNDGSIIFGQEAKESQRSGDVNTAAGFKRFMGSREIFKECYGKSYTAEDLSSVMLYGLVKEAEIASGQKIDAAVITVPAYFNAPERTATLNAACKAGIQVLEIINEPTAAALAYGLNHLDKEQTVLVYDLGGGTFDVTIAHINNEKIDVVGCSGNHELGGKDWDNRLAGYIIDCIAEEYDIDISENEQVCTALWVLAENAKKQLTSEQSANVILNCGGTDVSVDITREVFEEITSYLVSETESVIEKLFASLGIGWGDIDGTILVGGSTKMPMISEYIAKVSGKTPLGGIDAEEAVVLGAAVKANMQGSKISGLLGAGFDLLPGEKIITDVTAHSMGMIAISADGTKYVNSIIIPKNTSIPASETKTYSFRTGGRNDELEIYVLQGDLERPLDNAIINKYSVVGMQHLPDGNTMIDVTFTYNANAVVEVNAVQRETRGVLTVKAMPVPEDMSWTDASPVDNVQPVFTSGTIVLAVDLSGSMVGKPMRTAIKAIETFVSKLDPKRIKIGLVAFADKVQAICMPTNNYGYLIEKVRALPDIWVGEGNRAEPFTLASQMLPGRDARYIVTLTDGRWYKPDVAIAAAAACHRCGMEVVALGFGTADYDFLKKIASTERYAEFTDLDDLNNSFSKIAQVISSAFSGLQTS